MSSQFEEKLIDYLSNVLKAVSEPSKTHLFLSFVRDVFKGVNVDYAERLYPQLEKRVRVYRGTVIVSGRIDVLLGNLIFEFESDLTETKLKEAESQLKKYVAILWSGKLHRVEWLTVACDGINFRVYRPRTPVPFGEKVTSNDVVLEEVDKCNLEDMYHKQGADWAYVWLDRYLLYRTLIPPTTEEFVKDFGSISPLYKISTSVLKDAWKNIKETGAKTLYNEWAKYLEIVYGSRVESEDLFLTHTYLATLAKLMAYMFYSGAALPSSDEVEKVISGEVFREWGIYGFLEEDFFSWILKETIEDYGLKFIMDLLRGLKRYDLTKLEEDVLKGLYQELVDPKERHDLGEYYTPDWLAESIVKEALEKHPEASVLDPACGSGTFLAATIRFKKKTLYGTRSGEDLLNHILTNTAGIDIHPLAVITTKVNFLLALGDIITKYRRGKVAVPVYMADSIRLPTRVKTLEEGVVVYVVSASKGTNFLIPSIVAENAEVHDEVMEALRDYVKSVTECDETTFKNFIKLRSEKLSKILEKSPKLARGVVKSLFKSALIMSELEKEGKDTIWAFILKNLFKPLFFFSRAKKFDILIGNPPWLSYRYVRSTDYQEELKRLIIDRYQLLPEDKAELMTHMELATLFFARTSDLYLKDNGTIGFVMPRSVFPADQHDNFRKGVFAPKLGFDKILDLLNVEPLFNVPSSVFIAEKGKSVKYPVKVLVFSGKLPKKNCKLEEAENYISKHETNIYLGGIGERSFLTEKVLQIPKRKSAYYNKIYQGATIVPRQFWFIDIISHPRFGMNLQTPYIKTSERAIRLAKEPYKDLALEGNVESDFLYGVLTGSEIVPFGCLDPLIIVSPIRPSGNGYRLINSEEARIRGLLNLGKWLEQAEKEWEKRRGEKAKRMTIYERLDRQMGMSRQNPKIKYRVIYNTSGTYLVSAVVENRKPIISINDIEMQLHGIIIDHKLYNYETDDEDEAYYLSAILNSNIIDEAIKPAQSRGLFGPRDIHKKPFEITIPKFDSNNPVHERLSELCKQCTVEVKRLLPKLTKKYKSIGYIRKTIKEELSEKLDDINGLVLKIFETSKAEGLEGFISFTK